MAQVGSDEDPWWLYQEELRDGRACFCVARLANYGTSLVLPVGELQLGGLRDVAQWLSKDYWSRRDHYIRPVPEDDFFPFDWTPPTQDDWQMLLQQLPSDLRKAVRDYNK